ncbi:hypothetical protein EMIT0324P_150009 [Pseudomonas chlororaphis]
MSGRECQSQAAVAAVGRPGDRTGQAHRAVRFAGLRPDRSLAVARQRLQGIGVAAVER